jgi:putative membrane protein
MRRINISQAVWFILLLGFSFYLFVLVITGDITKFIHPRMNIYIYFALGTLMIMAAFQGTRVFEAGEGRIKKGYAVFLLPLVCGMFMNPGSLNGDISKNKGVVISPSQADLEYKDSSYVEGSVINGIITLTENNFTKVLYSIWSSPDKYVGRRIALEGFIYRDEAMAANQLIISRMIINCCAADTVVVGLAAEYRGEENLQEDKWISVVGTITMISCINPLTKTVETVPGINIDSLEAIEKPKNPYVYP